MNPSTIGLLHIMPGIVRQIEVFCGDPVVTVPLAVRFEPAIYRLLLRTFAPIELSR